MTDYIKAGSAYVAPGHVLIVDDEANEPRLGPEDGSTVVMPTVKLGDRGMVFGTDEPILSREAASCEQALERG